MAQAHESHKMPLSLVEWSRQPILWWSQWGLYCSGRVVGIAKPCTQHRSFGYKSLLDGIHPVSRAHLCKPVKVRRRPLEVKVRSAWEVELDQAIDGEAADLQEVISLELDAIDFWQAEHQEWCGLGLWAESQPLP